MGRSSGKAMEREIRNGLKSFAGKETLWWRRWPDYLDFIKINPKLRAPKAPADFIAIYHSRVYFLESKSTRSKRFQMSWLKEHQKEALLAVEKSGGFGFIVFSKRGRPVRGCAIRIQDFIELEDECKARGRKSIPTELILERGIEIPRLRGNFDLSPIFRIKHKRN